MLCCLMICTITIDARTVNDIYKRISAQVSLKVPGNQSRNYSLAFQGAVDDKGIYLPANPQARKRHTGIRVCVERSRSASQFMRTRGMPSVFAA